MPLASKKCDKENFCRVMKRIGMESLMAEEGLSEEQTVGSKPCGELLGGGRKHSRRNNRCKARR